MVFYFLPEDYEARSYKLTDIYSFGCVVFNIFTLKQPMPNGKLQTAEISIQDVKSLVEQCLSGEIESMGEVTAALSM